MIQLPSPADDLYNEIQQIPTIDAHEHLNTEVERINKKIDVTTLFTHYCKSDLEAAGLPQGPAQKEIFDTSKPLAPRWQKFKPYLAAIKFGSYAYPAYAYIKDVLGFDDINDDTVEPISAKLKADNTPGHYKRVMRDLCNIETVIQCKEGVEEDQSFFVYLCRSRAGFRYHRKAIELLESETGHSIHTLPDAVSAIHDHVKIQKDAGAVGLKVGDAYDRMIDYPDVTAADAERVLCKVRSGTRSSPSDDEGMILDNYLMRRQIEACIEHDMPVVIHTGYQANNGNDIRNARATHLWSLLKSYPAARFDLFHGSFPYTSDMTVLGKYFANVSLNMCWMHIMGYDASALALSEWLDAVPVNKIFAFGGDYQIVEKVYGHLQLARANVARVLADKIQQGRMTRNDALDIAKLLFYDNPKRWYKL